MLANLTTVQPIESFLAASSAEGVSSVQDIQSVSSIQAVQSMSVYAASAPRLIGYSIAGLGVVALLVFLITQLRKSQGGSDYAPNLAPPVPDEVLETTRLDLVLKTSLMMLVLIAIGLPWYWSKEPTRQERKAAEMQEEAVKRGYQIFQATTSPAEPGGQQPYGCAGCHGSVGQGGAAPWTITDPAGRTKSVQWAAPAVNVAFLRYTKSEVSDILVYGRQGKPMPAWGAEGGGPMSPQQITDVMAYLETVPEFEKSEDGSCAPNYRTGISLSAEVYVNPEDGSIPPENFDEHCEFKPISEQRADFAAETGTPITQAQFQSLKEFRDGLTSAINLKDANNNPAPVPSSGQLLFQSNCARCHTKGATVGEPEKQGAGWFGPNLTGGKSLTQFPDKASQEQFISEGVEKGKPYGTGGISKGVMPHFGNTLTSGQIDQIINYVRGL